MSSIVTAVTCWPGHTRGSTWRLKNSCIWLGDHAILKKGSSGSARNAWFDPEVWLLALGADDDDSESSLNMVESRPEPVSAWSAASLRQWQRHELGVAAAVCTSSTAGACPEPWLP